MLTQTVNGFSEHFRGLWIPPGGRYFAEFDDQAPVTREGQLLFFAQFLQAGGRWERFVSNTPLYYVGNRGSAVVDVLKA